MAKKLTPREQAFCEEYMIDLNATQAAVRAGYKITTAGDASAWIHPEHPERPHMREYLDRRLAERARRTGVSQDRVVQELARVAFLEATDVIDITDASVKADASKDDRAVIQSIRVRAVPTRHGESVEREVRFADKLKALELLGKHLGMFVDNVNISADRPIIVDNIPGGAPDA